jgi:formyl-CoA transferase
MGGLRYVTGFPDRPPVKPGVSIGDGIAGLWGAIGALTALRHRDVTGGRGRGQGQVVDVALYEAVLAMMESLVPEFDVFGFVRERTGNIMPGVTPSNTHTTRDGHHVIIGANSDAIFARLMRAVGRADLAEDPSLRDNAGRDARRNEIYRILDEWAACRDETEVLDALRQAEVPASRVYSAADMFADPQFLARGVLEEARMPDGRRFRIPAVVPRLTESPGGTDWLGPSLGEHTDAVLAGLGYSDERIRALRESGAI